MNRSEPMIGWSYFSNAGLLQATHWCGRCGSRWFEHLGSVED